MYSLGQPPVRCRPKKRPKSLLTMCTSPRVVCAPMSPLAPPSHSPCIPLSPSRCQIRARPTFLASFYISSLSLVAVSLFSYSPPDNPPPARPHRTPILSLVNDDGLRRLWPRQGSISMYPLFLHLGNHHYRTVPNFRPSQVPRLRIAIPFSLRTLPQSSPQMRLTR